MASAAGDCPYVGLQPFTQEQSAYFFGREREIKIISANLYASHLTILYGPSGAGKSSVLCAGVLPHLAKAARTVVVYFNRWQDESFLSLLKARLVSTVEAATGESLTIDAGATLDEVLHAASDAYGGTILIIFDQFEEYLVYHPESRDGGFEAEFASAVNSDDIDASFLISLREDWLANLQRFDVRIPNFFGNQLRVRALGRKAAQDALCKPLEIYNARSPEPVSMESSLVAAILEEASATGIAGDSAGAGQSPSGDDADVIEPSLLQLVMVRLWQEQALSRSLTLARFHELGGVKRISEQHLTTVLDRLTREEVEIADRSFRYLVMPQGNKIAQTTENLISVAEHPEEAVRRTLGKLSDARILSRTYPPERYEITHDVLCPAVLEWRRKRAREEAERRAEEEARAARRFRRLSLALGTMFLAAAVAAVVAWTQWMRSWSRELSVAAVTQLSVDPENSIVLALEALQKWHTPEAEGAVHRALMTSRVRATLEGHSAAVRKAAFSLDGKFVATGSMDGSVKLWEAGGRLARSIEGANAGGVLAVTFSPDGCCVASAGMDNGAKIWRIASGDRVLTLNGHEKAVSDVAFASRTIATASHDGTVRLWNAQNGTPEGMLRIDSPDAEVNAVAFGSDGNLLAAADSEGKVYVWTAETHRLANSFTCAFAVQDVKFSPDGRFLAAASARSVTIWDLATSTTVSERSAHTGAIYSLAFSPDGRQLATASQDGTVKIWSTRTEAEEITLSGHRGAVRSISFSPHESVVSASEDGTARVWTTGPVGEDLAIPVAPGSLASVAFSADGQRLLTSGEQANSVAVWDARTGAQIQSLFGHTADVLDARFSSDGTKIVTGSRDGTVRLWSASTGEELQSFTAGGWVQTVAFDPSGTRVAAGGYARTYLWSVTAASPVELQPQATDRVDKVAFSPDGRTLAAASSDGSVSVWDVPSQKLESRVSERRNFSSLAFLANGRSVVIGAEDGSLRFWNLGNRRIERTLPAHTGRVHAISVVRTQIGTGGADGTVHLWDAGSGDKILTLDAQNGEVRDLAFNSDGTQLATASTDGVVRIFHLDVRTLPSFSLTRITREELRQRVREHRFWR